MPRNTPGKLEKRGQQVVKMRVVVRDVIVKPRGEEQDKKQEDQACYGLFFVISQILGNNPFLIININILQS